MFADHSLAARIEAAEGRLCAACVPSVPGASVTAIGGGVAVFVRPGSPVNKVIGLGFGQTDLAALQHELAALEARLPLRVELSTLADPAIGQLLSRRGYQLQAFENVLGIALPTAVRDTTLGIDITDDEDPLWGEVAVDGFAVPDETSEHAENLPREIVQEIMSDFVRAPGFRRYLARQGGAPVGAASLRLEGDIALLSGATTLPRFRRRGVQTALLNWRLVDAAAAGCTDAILTCSPGTRSQANAHRQGFSLLYSRAVLVREAA